MGDGGAGSLDAYRLPVEGQELIHPFGNGLQLHYGHTSGLISKSISVVGSTEEQRMQTKVTPLAIRVGVDVLRVEHPSAYSNLLRCVWLRAN